MLNFKKVLPLKSDEEIEQMEAKEKEEYEKEINKDYKEKVKKLLECCKKFKSYLEKTEDEPADWYVKFGETFKDYLRSKKLFSRTNSILKDIQKQLSKPKCNWSDHTYYQKIFKFTPKRIDKDGYIKRSAIDDKSIAQFFNKIFPDIIRDIFNKHDKEVQKNNVDGYSGMIISKFFNGSNDFKNLVQVNSKFKENIENYHFNPIPLTKSNRKLFSRIETLYLYSPDDPIFTDGMIKTIHFAYDKTIPDIDIKTEQSKKYNSVPLTTPQIRKFYKNIETQYVYSDKDTIFNDGKIKNHYITMGDTIPAGTFSGCKQLKDVIISKGTKKINGHAFYKCENLQCVTIPNSVDSIDYAAFQTFSNSFEKILTLIFNDGINNNLQISNQVMKTNILVKHRGGIPSAIITNLKNSFHSGETWNGKSWETHIHTKFEKI